MAQAQLKLQAYEPALNSVDAVLKCQPNNVKALFRKGKILGEKGSTEKALEILRAASSLEPDNKAILQEIAQLTQRQKKEHHSEKLLYKRMFKDSSDKSSETKSDSDKGTSYKSAFTMGLVLTELQPPQLESWPIVYGRRKSVVIEQTSNRSMTTMITIGGVFQQEEQQ
ncbi:Peptidyl-prolyl cis-trans isomerase FKBP8 [Orchesella cincta]|uniref:Peptidyl-prolyl cis-trans isomerase FKBP8 n=1 Tax=Orchesella cincta TaxID=48709 RepID=A0A1D2MFY5_ORCCI|nr:Peptidyl-prolyl cis-trans isomerase FKBP8 [Orchesella cincta]